MPFCSIFTGWTEPTRLESRHDLLPGGEAGDLDFSGRNQEGVSYQRRGDFRSAEFIAPESLMVPCRPAGRNISFNFPIPDLERTEVRAPVWSPGCRPDLRVDCPSPANHV